ncbi:hypothetical protein [Qipengyuania sediminis]|uniref:hypothetical protein n=1 Tax=Qipengyuania sediminis TaxID=1532023 RepID=UPI00105A4589|nr:hypothetical protein [Qipengyuania sediminis]
MIGKVLGAFIGGKAAQHVRGIQGPTGAALGVLAPMILRRMSWPAMAAIGIGGYLAKKAFDKQAAQPAGSGAGSPRPAN